METYEGGSVAAFVGSLEGAGPVLRTTGAVSAGGSRAAAAVV